MSSVYFISVVDQDDDVRCAGWFLSRERAVGAVLVNEMDVNPEEFPWVVIEHSQEGLWSDEEPTWYRWDGELHRYVECDVPDHCNRDFYWANVTV